MGKQLVVALFTDEAAADQAVKLLKAWDKANDEVKLGAIGVLVKDEKGKIKTHKVGSRRTVGGAILFGLAGLLSGGITVIGGVIGGAILGSLFRKGGVKIAEYELAALGSELDGGKAAVGLMVNDEEAGLVKAKLIELGGVPASYEVSREAVEEAVQAAEAAPVEEVEPVAEAAPVEEAAPAADEAPAQPEAAEEQPAA